MTNNLAINTEPGNGPANPQLRDTIFYVCRILSTLAWIAIILWVLSPKGSRWGNAAGDTGLAWLLLTGGGYFAEQTVRSFANRWMAHPTSRHEETASNHEGHSTK